MKTTAHNDNRYTLDDWNFGDLQEDIELCRLAKKMYELLKKDPRCQYLGQGRHRHAFRRGDFVYKIAWNWDGIIANSEELLICSKHKHKHDKDYICYALCRRINDVCIVMEYLEEFWKQHTVKVLPKWTLCVDSLQVGYSKHGKLKAYDFSMI